MANHPASQPSGDPVEGGTPGPRVCAPCHSSHLATVPTRHNSHPATAPTQPQLPPGHHTHLISRAGCPCLPPHTSLPHAPEVRFPRRPGVISSRAALKPQCGDGQRLLLRVSKGGSGERSQKHASETSDPGPKVFFPFQIAPGHEDACAADPLLLLFGSEPEVDRCMCRSQLPALTWGSSRSGASQGHLLAAPGGASCRPPQLLVVRVTV